MGNELSRRSVHNLEYAIAFGSPDSPEWEGVGISWSRSICQRSIRLGGDRIDSISQL